MDILGRGYVLIPSGSERVKVFTWWLQLFHNVHTLPLSA